MFDIGWTELILIGVVALIVIGPKDLPVMFQTLGRFTGRIRGMAREFTTAMEQAARDSGVQDAAKDLKSLTSTKGMGLDTMREAADRFEKWDPLKPKLPTAGQATPATPPAPVSATPAGPATAALREQVAARREAASQVGAPAAATDTSGTDPSDKAPQA